MNGKRIIKNASWIIACRVIQAILGLVITMMTSRYLGPSNYGILNYATSVTAFVIPIAQLGLNAIIIQEIVIKPEEEGETMGTALSMVSFSSILGIIGVVAFVNIANRGELETIVVCSLYSVTLLFQALEIMLYWFQAQLLSKYTSIVELIAYILVSLYKIFLLINKKNIYWFAFSYIFDYLFIDLGLFFLYKKLGGKKLSFSINKAKVMFNKSKYYILSALMVTLFAQTDRVMIKLMLDNASVGYYSAAVTCISMSGFVFTAIIDSCRPMIFESQNNKMRFEHNMQLVYAIIICLAVLQSICFSILAKFIILVIYGNQYLKAVITLRILVWYITFSYIGGIRDIWVLAENKQKYLVSINMCGAITNIVLNYLLIPLLGINGAALASLTTQFVTNILIGFILKPIRRNNYLIFKSICKENLKEIFTFLKLRKRNGY